MSADHFNQNFSDQKYIRNLLRLFSARDRSRKETSRARRFRFRDRNRQRVANEHKDDERDRDGADYETHQIRQHCRRNQQIQKRADGPNLRRRSIEAKLRLGVDGFGDRV